MKDTVVQMPPVKLQNQSPPLHKPPLSQNTRITNHQSNSQEPALTQNISKCAETDSNLFSTFGWEAFIKANRGRGDLHNVMPISHPAEELLVQLRDQVATVQFTTPDWPAGRILQALDQGPHRSAVHQEPFVMSKMAEMIAWNQWVVLPFRLIKHLPGLRISPLGVVPQHYR